MKKSCKTCGREVIGRTDKKFCNEACKNEFHNGRLKEPDGNLRIYASASRRNREILRSLANEGISDIDSGELETTGFDFKSITGIEFLKRGEVKLYCHEFNLVKCGNGFRILQPEDCNPT